VVADDAHDVGLMALVVDGVAHGLAVDGQAFILLGVDRVPALQSPVELGRVDPDEKIADGELAGHQVLAAAASAAKALARLGREIVGPFGDRPCSVPGACFVSAHAAQDGAGSDGQNRRQRVAATPRFREGRLWRRRGSGMSAKKSGRVASGRQSA